MPTLEERVAYLEGRMEDHTALTGDLRNGLRELRADTGRQFTKLREELRGQCTALRSEITELREDTGREFRDLRADTNQQFADVRSQIHHLDEKSDRHFTWLIGIQVAVLVSVVGALVGSYYR